MAFPIPARPLRRRPTEVLEPYMTILKSDWALQTMTAIPLLNDADEIGLSLILHRITNRPENEQDCFRWFMAQGLDLERLQHQTSSLLAFIKVMTKVILTREKLAYNYFAQLTPTLQNDTMYLWDSPAPPKVTTVAERRFYLHHSPDIPYTFSNIVRAQRLQTPRYSMIPGSDRYIPNYHDYTDRPSFRTQQRRQTAHNYNLLQRPHPLPEEDQRQRALSPPSSPRLIIYPNLSEVDYWLWRSRVNKLWADKDLRRIQMSLSPLALYTKHSSNAIEAALIHESNIHHSEQRNQALQALQPPDLEHLSVQPQSPPPPPENIRENDTYDDDSDTDYNSSSLDDEDYQLEQEEEEELGLILRDLDLP